MKSNFPILILSLVVLAGCQSNDGPSPVQRSIQFSVANVSVSEQNSTFDITIAVDKPDPNFPATVNYSVIGGTATDGIDFQLASGVATIEKNATTATVSVTTVRDGKVEATETINIQLAAPVNATLGATTTCLVKIHDDPAPESLVLYLPFNGNSVDSSLYDNGPISSQVTFNADRNGNLASAATFDSLQTNVRIHNSEALNNIDSITLSVWIQPISWYGTGSNAVIQKPNSTDVHELPYYQYHLGITGDKYWHLKGCIIFSLGIGGEYIYLNSPTYAWVPGQWIQVTSTYDGATMKTYANGALIASQEMTGKIDKYGQDLFIGVSGFPTNLPSNTPGTFDAVRIYNRALSAEEVAILYSNY